MDNEKTEEEHERDIRDNVTLKKSKHRGNLFTNRSWSYIDNMDLHDKYYEVNTIDVCLKGDVIEVDENEIPEDFRIFSTIKSQYYKNRNSLSDKRALILCDDSIKPLVPPLLAYYKEVFIYQDLWYFNKELVDWFNPDDLLEIRSERTLENTQYQLVSIEENFVIPILRNVEEFKVVDNKLKIRISYKDLRLKNVKSACNIFVDKKLIDERNIDGVLDACYDINKGKHLVEVVLKAGDTTKRNVYKQELDVDK